MGTDGARGSQSRYGLELGRLGGPLYETHTLSDDADTVEQYSGSCR